VLFRGFAECSRAMVEAGGWSGEGGLEVSKGFADHCSIAASMAVFVDLPAHLAEFTALFDHLSHAGTCEVFELRLSACDRSVLAGLPLSRFGIIPGSVLDELADLLRPPRMRHVELLLSWVRCHSRQGPANHSGECGSNR
jgi:hypothetical protein